MWRCSVDSQTDIPSVIPAPESSAPKASSGTGGAAARKASGSAKRPSVSATNTSGRRGLTWVASRLPTRAPTPTAASTTPHAAAPPRSRSATTGPSAFHAPQSMFPTRSRRRRSRPSGATGRRPSPRAGRRRRSSSAPRRAPGTRSIARHAALTANVAASTAIAHPAPAVATSTPGGERAEDLARRERARAQRVRRLQLLRGDDLRQQAGRGGVEEAGGRAGHAGQQREHPHLRHARDEQRRHRALARDPHEVRDHHHGAARGPVGDDAAHQHARDQREHRRGEHEPDVRGGAADLQHRERERDGDHAVAEDGHGLPAEEQPELAPAEDSEALGQPRHEGRRLAS